MVGAGRPIDPGPLSLWRTARSFQFALAGIWYVVRTQPNFRVHLAVAGLVLVGGVWFQVSRTEMAVLLLTIGLVLAAEALNTAIEAVVDLASPDYHLLAKGAKDASAAGVLLATFAAVLVGLVVLGPPLVAAVMRALTH